MSFNKSLQIYWVWIRKLPDITQREKSTVIIIVAHYSKTKF